MNIKVAAFTVSEKSSNKTILNAYELETICPWLNSMSVSGHMKHTLNIHEPYLSTLSSYVIS